MTCRTIIKNVVHSVHSSMNRGIRSFKSFRGGCSAAMRTIKFPVLVLGVAARLCRAEVVIASLTPDQSTSDLVEDLVNIVTSCYGDLIIGIGLAGDLPDGLPRALWTQHSIPVALMDNRTKFGERGYWEPHLKFRRKLPIFIVEASSGHQLATIVHMNIRWSIWWNHMASFFILDRSPGCKESAGYLLTVWLFNIPNAKVMCYGDGSERVIKNYNPFTSLAPDPWKKSATFPGKNGHPFTVFVRELPGNESICVNLDFDKSRDLGGLSIEVEGNPPDKIPRTKNDLSRNEYLETNKNIFDSVYGTLNAKPKLTPARSFLLRVDVRANPIWMLWTWNTTITAYPHQLTGFVLVSQFRGNKSQLQKILGVIDIDSHIGLGIAYLVTLMFFKFVVRQAVAPAILNLVRITCAAGFADVPDSNPPRIYLTGILFFAVTMHGIFEGNLASLLTTVIPLRNINTMKDLMDFDYTIYGTAAHRNLVEHPTLRERFVTIGGTEDCIRSVRNDKSGACIDYGIGETLDLAREFKLHVSGEFIKTSYITFEIRWDWPIEERFNMLLSRLVESDSLQPWDVKCNPTKLEDFQIDEEVKNNKVFKKIEFAELTFAFVILGIGLVLATMTFIGELLTQFSWRSICRGKRRIVVVRAWVRD